MRQKGKWELRKQRLSVSSTRGIDTEKERVRQGITAHGDSWQPVLWFVDRWENVSHDGAVRQVEVSLPDTANHAPDGRIQRGRYLQERWNREDQVLM